MSAANKNRPEGADLGPEAYYFAALGRGEFKIQRCGGCGKHVFFPRVLCPHCGASALSWVAASGMGTVHSTTYMPRKPEHGGDYNVAIIRLDEGVQMMSRVEKIAPQKVAIGMRVRAAIRKTSDRPMVVFEPAGRS